MLTRMCILSTTGLLHAAFGENGERRGLSGLAVDWSKSVWTKWRLHKSLESFD